MSGSPRPSRLSSSVVQATLEAFRGHKHLADGAIRQTSDENLRKALDPNTNSIAVIIKHLAGNMLSRCTEFLTSDGEKPSRNRDGEFIDDFADRAAILAFWERGWTCLFEEFGKLTDADLFRTITIRGEPHHVIDALQRQLAHLSYHVGQIVFIARHLAGDNWTVLTIPRGGSKQFNDQLAAQLKSRLR